MAESVLNELVEQLRQATGILHKQDIQLIAASPAQSQILIGDDCAAIPDAGGYLLLASEGLLPQLVETDPWFAGWCAVMVNLSDIAAMGGRSIALVDALWSRSSQQAEQIWAGIQAAAQAYKVPIVGGHTNCRSPYDALSVSVLGRASQIISSFQAQPGDALLMAIDLSGEFHADYPFWNAATNAEPHRLRQNLEILPHLAEAQLCDAGKDISMGGIIGTLLMLLETSACGAILNLDTVPQPRHVPLDRWLLSFPSYGFLLSVEPHQVAAVQTQFQEQQISCEMIGRITDSRQLWLRCGSQSVQFWDLAQTPVLGFAPKPDQETRSGQPLRRENQEGRC